ncbi:hypothetical protein ACFRH4_41665, partial [Streptomyces mirabilis]|uniref:hypothetical protein n=1 Tax=Streptomyces mirabilis TaxID=68239 RepID=UPI0036B99835
MPYLEQPRTPLTAEEVELAFEYLLAIQDRSEHALAAVIDRTNAVPAPTVLLLRLAEDVILPVTDLAPDADPCASFALDEVGGVLLAALEEWTRECVPSAIWGIANTIIRFTENVLRQEGEDTVDDAHRAPGAGPRGVTPPWPVRTSSAPLCAPGAYRAAGGGAAGGPP